MKNRFRLLSTLAVAAAGLCLSACNFATATADTSKAAATTSAVATGVKTAFALIPASVEAKFDALAAKYPQALPYVTSIANAFESAANLEGDLPSAATVSADVSPWLTGLSLIPGYGPEISAFGTGALAIYKLAQPAMANTGAAVAEFAELIRSYAASATPAATAVTQGGLARAHAAYRLAFAVLHRRD